MASVKVSMPLFVICVCAYVCTTQSFFVVLFGRYWFLCRDPKFERVYKVRIETVVVVHGREKIRKLELVSNEATKKLQTNERDYNGTILILRNFFSFPSPGKRGSSCFFFWSNNSKHLRLFPGFGLLCPGPASTPNAPRQTRVHA